MWAWSILVHCGFNFAGPDRHELLPAAAVVRHPHRRVLAHQVVAALVALELAAHGSSAALQQLAGGALQLAALESKVAVVASIAVRRAERRDHRFCRHRLQSRDQLAEGHLSLGALSPPFGAHGIHERLKWAVVGCGHGQAPVAREMVLSPGKFMVVASGQWLKERALALERGDGKRWEGGKARRRA